MPGLCPTPQFLAVHASWLPENSDSHSCTFLSICLAAQKPLAAVLVQNTSQSHSLLSDFTLMHVLAHCSHSTSALTAFHCMPLNQQQTLMPSSQLLVPDQVQLSRTLIKVSALPRFCNLPGSDLVDSVVKTRPPGTRKGGGGVAASKLPRHRVAGYTLPRVAEQQREGAQLW